MYSFIKHNNEQISIKTLSVKANSLVTYYEYQGFNNRSKSDVTQLDNKRNDELSYKAKKRMENAIDWMYYLSGKKNSKGVIFYRLSDITLAIPNQKVNDHDIIKKGLNQFLTECRKKFNMLYYVWKAETQKNGNLHFHILTNSYIDKKVLQDTWNRILSKKSLQIIEKGIDYPSTNVRGVIFKTKDKELSQLRKKYASKENTGLSAVDKKNGVNYLKRLEMLNFLNCVKNMLLRLKPTNEMLLVKYGIFRKSFQGLKNFQFQ